MESIVISKERAARDSHGVGLNRARLSFLRLLSLFVADYLLLLCRLFQLRVSAFVVRLVNRRIGIVILLTKQARLIV